MKQPNWTDRTAVIICAGPSLTDGQIEAARTSGAKLIAVNTAYLYAPWTHIVFGSDFMFWKVHGDRIKKQTPSALWTTDSSAAERFQINRQRAGQRDGLGLTVCHMFGNSGMNAINVAYLWGARKVLLLGMDMKLGSAGEKHRHGDHEKGLTQAQCFEEWIHKGKRLAEDLKTQGCDVANCTPGSALPWFRMSTIQEELV